MRLEIRLCWFRLQNLDTHDVCVNDVRMNTNANLMTELASQDEILPEPKRGIVFHLREVLAYTGDMGYFSLQIEYDAHI